MAGVSRSAVSRTFTDGASVSPATRAKVVKAAQTLGYHVNHLARGLSKEESRPICILVSTLKKPYHAQLLDTLTLELQKAGRIIILINVGDRPDNAADALEQALNYRAAASVVISGAPPADLVQRCVDAGQKVILVNRDENLPNVHHIRNDYEKAMEQAAALFEQANCKRVAIVSRKARTPSIIGRETCLAGSLSSRGIAVDIWRGASTTYETGQLAARDLFLGAERPDGIFCANDLLAFGVIDAARDDFQLRAPDDYCILGFDDVEQAQWSAYDLTSYAQPYAEIAEVITAIVGGKNEPHKTHQLLPTLAWRRTMNRR